MTVANTIKIKVKVTN